MKKENTKRPIEKKTLNDINSPQFPDTQTSFKVPIKKVNINVPTVDGMERPKCRIFQCDPRDFNVGTVVEFNQMRSANIIGSRVIVKKGIPIPTSSVNDSLSSNGEIISLMCMDKREAPILS